MGRGCDNKKQRDTRTEHNTMGRGYKKKQCDTKTEHKTMGRGCDNKKYCDTRTEHKTIGRGCDKKKQSVTQGQSARQWADGVITRSRV